MWIAKTTLWLTLTGSYVLLMLWVVSRALSGRARSESRRYLTMLKAIAVGLLFLMAMSVSKYLALLQVPCAVVLWHLYWPYIRIEDHVLRLRSGREITAMELSDVLGSDLEFNESDPPPVVKSFVIRTKGHGTIELSGFYCSDAFMQRAVEAFGVNVEAAKRAARAARAEFLVVVLGCVMIATVNVVYANVQARNPGGSSGEPRMLGGAANSP